MANLQPPYRRSPSPLIAALAAPTDDDQCTTTLSPSRKPHPSGDIVLLSPTPTRRSKQRISIPAAEEGRKLRGSPAAPAPAVVSSPRNQRRARRRLVAEKVDDAAAADDGAAKARRKKPGRVKARTAPKEEEVSLVPVAATADDAPAAAAIPCSRQQYSDCSELWERIVDLAMWRSAARSALWFGLGTMLFLSSSFSGDLGFSVISAICHLAVAVLAVAFAKDIVPQRRQPVEQMRALRLTEEDVLRAARLLLPVANSALAMAQVVFSGDPAVTLKVLPFLIFGAKYGRLITFWRLLATAFFVGFTVPKIYSCYSKQIHSAAAAARGHILDAWKPFPHKRFVAAAAVATCWNMVTVKTRIVAAFAAMVILRYYQQHLRENKEEDATTEEQGVEAAATAVAEETCLE